MSQVFDGVTKSFRMISLLRKVCNHADLVTSPQLKNNEFTTNHAIKLSSQAATRATAKHNIDDTQYGEDGEDEFFDHGVKTSDLVDDTAGYTHTQLLIFFFLVFFFLFFFFFFSSNYLSVINFFFSISLIYIFHYFNIS